MGQVCDPLRTSLVNQMRGKKGGSSSAAGSHLATDDDFRAHSLIGIFSTSGSVSAETWQASQHPTPSGARGFCLEPSSKSPSCLTLTICPKPVLAFFHPGLAKIRLPW